MVLTAILATLCGSMIVAAIIFWMWSLHLKRDAEAQERRQFWVEALAAAKSLVEAQTQARESLTTVPALLDGMKKIAMEQVIQINSLRSEIANFRKLMFKKDEIRPVQTPTDEEKGYWWDVEQLMKDDPSLSREAAFQKVLDHAVNEQAEFNLAE